MNSKSYENPLVVRYSSQEMIYNFSDEMKFLTWRRLWLALAEAEKELGLDISDEQIKEMRETLENIDFELAAKYEKELRHDVMAHIHTWGEIAKNARKIIHLGATSAFVGDNTDIIVMHKGLKIIREKLLVLMKYLADFSMEYKDLPTLGYTHFQPAQITTVGKRASLWLYDLYMDLLDLDYTMNNLKLRGVKGTTGTQASFMELFNGDEEKIKGLEKRVCEKMGFKEAYYVTGQTYSRKVDYSVLSVLSRISQSLHKFANDIRLLQHKREIQEPFEKNQVGSSAMPYKKNPMRSERICAIARFVINLEANGAFTEATQWFERTLDDSANKRLTIPQAFLGVDAILIIAINILKGIIVNKNIIENNLLQELPFMMTENILMSAVKKGGDRQELHEIIRTLSLEAYENIYKIGKNNLLELIENNEKFKLTKEDLEKIKDPKLYIGRAPNQVKEFIEEVINPLLEANKDVLDFNANKYELKV